MDHFVMIRHHCLNVDTMNHPATAASDLPWK